MTAADFCAAIQHNKNAHQGDLLQQQLQQRYSGGKKKSTLEVSASGVKRSSSSTMTPTLRTDVPQNQMLVDKKAYSELKKELAQKKKDSLDWNRKYLAAKKQRDECNTAKKAVEQELNELMDAHEELKGKVEDIVNKGKGKSNTLQARILQSKDVCDEITPFVREYVCRNIKFALDEATLNIAIDKTWSGIKDRLKLERRPKNLTREKFGQIYGCAVSGAIAKARQYTQTRGIAAAEGTYLV